MKTYPTLFVTALALLFSLGACTPPPPTPPPPPPQKPLPDHAKPAVTHNTTVPVRKHHYSSEETKPVVKRTPKEGVVTDKPPGPSTKTTTVPKKPVSAEVTGDSPSDYNVTPPSKDGKSH